LGSGSSRVRSRFSQASPDPKTVRNEPGAAARPKLAPFTMPAAE
jgi:hypothetical protein